MLSQEPHHDWHPCVAPFDEFCISAPPTKHDQLWRGASHELLVQSLGSYYFLLHHRLHYACESWTEFEVPYLQLRPSWPMLYHHLHTSGLGLVSIVLFEAGFNSSWQLSFVPSALCTSFVSPLCMCLAWTCRSFMLALGLVMGLISIVMQRKKRKSVASCFRSLFIIHSFELHHLNLEVVH